MFGELNTNEVELLNAYSLLKTPAQKELKDYMRYLLCKQYKRDSMVAVLHNPLIHNLLHNIIHQVEKSEFDIAHLRARIKQLHDLYFGLFENVHHKYSEVIDDLDSNELVKDFGKNSFEDINRALDSENRIIIRAEIIEFYEVYNKMSRRKDARQIVAV